MRACGRRSGAHSAQAGGSQHRARQARPPPRAWALPASNCGLMSTTSSPPGRSTEQTWSGSKGEGVQGASVLAWAGPPCGGAHVEAAHTEAAALPSTQGSLAHTPWRRTQKLEEGKQEAEQDGKGDSLPLTASSTLSTEMKERSSVTMSTGVPPMSGSRSARRLVRSMTRTRGSVRTRSATWCAKRQPWRGGNGRGEEQQV